MQFVNDLTVLFFVIFTGADSNEDLFSKLRTKIAQFNAKDFDTYVEEVVAPEQTAAAPQVATRSAVAAPTEEEPVVETVCALQGEAAVSCEAAAGDSDCGKVIATYSSCQAFIDVALLCPQLVNAYQNCAQPPPPPKRTPVRCVPVSSPSVCTSSMGTSMPV